MTLPSVLVRQVLDIEVVGGEAGLVDIATDSQTDTVVAAIVGAAGLPSTLAAARAGKRILLANKEALVMAGQVMINAVKTHNATLLPLDSEHNAIFQCSATCYSARQHPNSSARSWCA